MMRKLKFLLIIILLSANIVFSKENLKEKSNSDIPPAKKALNIVVSYLKNSDSDIRAYAIEALSKTQNTKLINVIKEYLNDESKYVQIATVKALWKLGEIKYTKILKDIIYDIPQKNPNQTNPLEELKVISKNKIREKAIEAFVDLVGIKANKILLDLKENDNFPTIRDVAARELAKIGYKEELKNFYDALTSKDEDIRFKASESLIRICPYEQSNILEAFKKEKSLRIKLNLLKALKCSKLSNNEEEYLIKIYLDSDKETKYQIAEILSKTSFPKTIEFIKKLYDDTPDIMIKLIFLRKLYEEKIITITDEDVKYFLSIPSKEIKKKLIELSDIIPNSKNYLLEFLNDEDPYIKIDSAIAIIEKEAKKWIYF